MRLDQLLHSHRLLGTAAFIAALPWAPAFAADFTISGASSTAQTLGTAAGQTGNLTATGVLTVTGSANAVTFSGNNATLNNLGGIYQTGTGRLLRDNTGVTGLVVSNGSVSNATALMQSSDGDVFQMNKSSASVLLNNYGSMVSLNASAGGAQVVDFTAILSGANTVNNFATGSMTAKEADAVRTGVNGVVSNWGNITATSTTGSTSDGIDAQNNSGATISNFASGTVTGARHGITGGQTNATTSFTASISNAVGAVISGNNGSGLNFDGFNNLQVVSVINGGNIFGNGVTGDGDGIDVDGVVSITNTGVIRSINAFSAAGAGLAYSEGISVGGGSITNSGTIEGLVAAGNSNALGRGITLAGNDITSGALAGTREGLYANAVVTNQAGGLIRGQNDSAIFATGAASGYSVTLHNQAGATIRGGGTTSAAIVTGKDNTTINNAGTIDGSSSGKAIEMGSGNNTLNVSGGSASIVGSINGGLGGSNQLTLSPGAGNSFNYAGSISNFNRVEVLNGNVRFSGVSSYTGATRLSGGTLTLDGANRLSASSALELNGGTLKISNAGGTVGQVFGSLVLSDSSTIDLGSSVLVFNSLGTITSGKTLSVLNASANGYAFQLLGDYSGDMAFASLLGATTINGMAARYHFDGAYTDVTAVPEPDTLAMLLAGVGLIGTVTRRRRQNRV